ncbi:hypothetical protein HDU84_001645, partial [Entophlyctis sp. JEL0112]
MFFSSHTFSSLHACSRAVSGSPIYVSDKPGAHNADLIKSLCVAGRALRCHNPARPTTASVFRNPTTRPGLFKIANVTTNGGGVLGVFNLRGDPSLREPAVGWVSAAEAVESANGEYAAYFAKSKTCKRVGRDEKVPVVIFSGDAEVVTFVRIQKSSPGGIFVGCIGLLGKLNGSVIVETASFSGGKLFTAKLWAAGVVGFYLESGVGNAIDSIESVSVNGNVVYNGTRTVNSTVWSEGTNVVAIDCCIGGNEAVRP